MNILAFDTYGKTCTVAVGTDQQIIEKFSDNGLTHSVNLMPMIDAALQEAAIAPTDLNYIAVVGGPGSFTGVRIGISCAKGLAHGLQIPCILLDTLDVLTALTAPERTLICPILDARAKQVYAKAVLASAAGVKEVISPAALLLDDFIESISEYPRILFCGDAVPIHREYIQSKLAQAMFSDVYCPRADVLIHKAKQYLDKAVHYYDLSPIYLRAPQAERMLKEKIDNARV